MAWSDTIVKIDPTQQYRLHSDEDLYPGGTSLFQGGDQPLKLATLDADRLLIESLHVTRYAYAADTHLAADLNPGASFILIANASGWSNAPWESPATRAIAWYGYADSTGQTYADYTYTRNVAEGNAGLWEPGGIRFDPAAGAYRIQLLEPWQGPAISAGTAVRNATGGLDVQSPNQTSQLIVASGVRYQQHMATVGGLWQNGTADPQAFPPGTAYLQPVLDGKAEWPGVEVAPEQDTVAFGPLDLTRPQVEVNSAQEIVLDLDVLGKHPFGTSANVVIAGVETPLVGTATLSAGPTGEILRYRSTPGFQGSVDVHYTLRNIENNALFAGSVAITVQAPDESLPAQQLLEIAIGLLNYEAFHDRFPVLDNPDYFDASGNPHLSWRVHALRYLDGLQSLYNQFHLDEPWDSPNNLPLASQMPSVFADFNDPTNTSTTRFRILGGEGGPYFWQRRSGLLTGPQLRQIGDGESNTLLVVQTGADAAVPWTQPELPNYQPGNPLAGLGTLDEGVIRGVTVDGSRLTLPATIDPELFHSLVTINGGEIVDAATLRRRYADLQAGDIEIQFGQPAGDIRFKQIELALLNYQAARDYFPIDFRALEADMPLLSWRVALLPYLGHSNLYDQFALDEPWDSPHNLALLDAMPDLFRSQGDTADSHLTRVQQLTYSTGEERTGFYLPPRETTSNTTVQRGASYQSIADGLSNTIAFVEAGPDKAVPWTQPADLAFDFANPLSTLGDLSSGSFRAVMLDNSVFHFPADIDPAALKALATRSSRETIDPVTHALDAQLSLTNSMKRIVLAMFEYQEARGRFPANTFSADGTPLLSWRVHLLPHLEQANLYQQFRLDEPWDSPHNLPLMKEMPSIFQDFEALAGASTTRIQTFTGPEAPFPASGTNATRGPTRQDLTDGLSNTYAFVQAGADVAVPWTKPADLPYHSNNPYSAMGDLGPRYAAAYFDGRVFDNRSAFDSISQLSQQITHQGGVSSNTPVATPYLRQSHGNTSINEFGVDWFDVVFDAAPEFPVTLELRNYPKTLSLFLPR